ncbi:MAG: putative glycosyltransferase [Gemmatimonadetes bacterium]|nr:putative glycosyltransferase [Gemmatimonadota bacterium]
MKPLRIAVYHDLPSGGAKRALREQVRRLVERGHDVHVYVPSTADERFLPLSELAGEPTVFARPPQPDREKALEGGPSPAAALRWLSYLAGVRRTEHQAASAIDAAGHDVALVAASQFTQAPWMLRRLSTPSLYYCQEPLRAAYEPRIAPPATRFAIRHTLGRVDRANTRAASTVAVNSRFSAGNVGRIYGVATRVNYLGVDAARFRPLPRPERGGYLLTVAAMHPLKGLDFLIDAVGRIPADERPPLAVVSDRAREAERARVEARARDAGVDVHFHFRVPEEELVRLYNGARLVVYAPYAEPFGFVPLEAMACARPVLGVAEGGIPETVVDGETGFLAPRDPDAFAARIRELLRDSTRAEAVASAAPAIVRERWNWARSVAGLDGLLRETAALRKR